MIRLGIRVCADRAEVALARLLPILQAGAEERAVDGAVEYAVYGPEGELPALDEIRALAGDTLLDVRSDPVPGGWEVRWHEHLRPVRVGGLVVRPPWIEGADGDLVIEPGTYFGAGTHPTTRLCLELLQECRAGGALCDWGSGTGVLAIAAARLGWGPVTAVEPAHGALELIRANAGRNGVAVEARALDVRAGAPWAPTVVANLPKPVLLDAARAGPRPAVEPPAARATVPRPARIIAAGMLSGDVDEVAAAFGMRVRRRVDEDGWAAVVLA